MHQCRPYNQWFFSLLRQSIVNDFNHAKVLVLACVLLIVFLLLQLRQDPFPDFQCVVLVFEKGQSFLILSFVWISLKFKVNFLKFCSIAF